MIISDSENENLLIIIFGFFFFKEVNYKNINREKNTFA